MAAPVPPPTTSPANPNKSMGFSKKGKDWLIQSEGTSVKDAKHVLYNDSRSFATVGYGHLVPRKSVAAEKDPAQKPYARGISEAEAQNLLDKDLKTHIDGIRMNVNLS